MGNVVLYASTGIWFGDQQRMYEHPHLLVYLGIIYDISVSSLYVLLFGNIGKCYFLLLIMSNFELAIVACYR